MYTYIVPNLLDGTPFIKYELNTIEEAYQACVTSPFSCKIIDVNGEEMSKEEMLERINGKTHIVLSYFPALKRRVWFKTKNNVEMFTTFRIVGSDKIAYDGVVIGEDFVKVLPVNIGKHTIN